MKRLMTKVFTIAACAAMIATAVPVTNMQSVQAATASQGTVNLTTNKLVITNGKKTAITNNTLQMVKGRKYQIKAKFGDTVVKSQATWKSTKPAIVTVSSTGLITAKAPGASTIKVTYKGKTQSFKVKVIASHTHDWKTITKATCANKGKKLCQTCGVTGSVKMKTTHTWKTTKKATCQTTGKKTCQVCGKTADIATKDHAWVTETWKETVGLGKGTDVGVKICSECRKDLTHATPDERTGHMFACHSTISQWVGTDYTGYKIVEISETYCKTCGDPAGKLTEKVIKKDTNATLHDHRNGLQEAMFITGGSDSSFTEPGSKPEVTTPAPSDPQDVITTPETPDVPETPTVSDNETVSDNIADADTGNSDVLSGNETGTTENEHIHNLQTEVTEEVEGRGEPYNAVTITCNKCGVDMSDWSAEEIDAHTFSLRNPACFGASVTRITGETEYPEYVVVETAKTICKDCGEVKDETRTDLYVCDADGNPITEDPDDPGEVIEDDDEDGVTENE